MYGIVLVVCITHNKDRDIKHGGFQSKTGVAFSKGVFLFFIGVARVYSGLQYTQ